MYINLLFVSTPPKQKNLVNCLHIFKSKSRLFYSVLREQPLVFIKQGTRYHFPTYNNKNVDTHTVQVYTFFNHWGYGRASASSRAKTTYTTQLCESAKLRESPRSAQNKCGFFALFSRALSAHDHSSRHASFSRSKAPSRVSSGLASICIETGPWFGPCPS